MDGNLNGNLLLVSNYPSDTAYAWWLMEHFWITQAEIFTQADHKAYLAYPKITSLSKTIMDSTIAPVELSLPWRSRKEAILARQFIKEHSISYIYFTDRPYFSLQYFLMRCYGVKRIIIHDHTPGDRPPVKGIKGALKLLKNATPWFTADRVLCVSELMRQRNILNSRIPARKCTVVQNGVRPIECRNIDKAQLKSDLGLPPESILVITTGRAHPYKRFDFVIRCAATLRDSHPNLDIVFLLVGDGPAMSELQHMILQLNLENQVRLLGFRNDVHTLLCISDIALHAALGEGFSLSIVEYMSAGLPVLVPDIPSVSQAIVHNKTGFIYDKNNFQAAASFVKMLATETQTRLTMGGAAKQCANDEYSLDLCTQSFIKTVSDIYAGTLSLKRTEK